MRLKGSINLGAIGEIKNIADASKQFAEASKDVVNTAPNTTNGVVVSGKKLPKWASIVMGLIFFVLGLVMLVLSPSYISKQTDMMKNYVSVDGQITDVVSEYDSSNDRYEYNCTVSYKVGERYYSTKYSDSVRRYHGDTVTMYYNPENPSEAVFEMSMSGLFLFPMVGIVFTIGGLSMMIFTFREKKKNA